MPDSLYKYLWSVNRRGQILLIVLTVLVFPLSMTPLELQRRIVNDAIEGADVDLLPLLGGGYLAYIMVHGGLEFLMNMQLARIIQQATSHLREAVYYRIYSVVPARTGLSVANASQHLQQLRRAGLVASRREGKFVLYSLADDGPLDLLAALRHVAERRIAEVERILRGYFAERDSMEPVSREELLARSRAGLVTVLDVRAADQFAMGHLPGAINIPLEELEARIAELDPAQEIVAYCRGAYCVLSFEAVDRLRTRGYRARRLEDGYPEWKAAGLEVAAETGH